MVRQRRPVPAVFALAATLLIASCSATTPAASTGATGPTPPGQTTQATATTPGSEAPSQPASAPAASATGGATGSPAAGGDPIVIGYSIAKTGGFAPYDLALQQGGRIAVDEINAAGGLLGRQLEIIDANTQSDLNLSAPGAQQLLAQGADAIISTSDYDFGGPAIREAVAAGKVGIGFAGDPLFGYHGIGPLAFNVHPGSPAEGAAMAEFAYESGWRRAFTLTDTINSYPPTISDFFETRFTELGGEVVGKDTFLNSDESIATQITGIRSANPDVILVASFPPGGASAVRQIRAAGIEAPIVGDAAFDGSEWIGAIPDLSGMFNPKLASADGNDPDPAMNEFFERYEEATGGPSALATYPAAGYVQIQVLAEGIRRAGTADGAAVAEAIAGLSDFETLFGPIDYAARPECNMPQSLPFKIFEVQDGQEVFVRDLTPTIPPFEC